jgi:acyl-CoA hydrolase
MSTRELSAVEAVGLIREVDTIGLGLVSRTPRTLLEELSRRSDWQDLTFNGGLLLGTYDVFAHPNVHYPCQFLRWRGTPLSRPGRQHRVRPSFFRHYGLLIQHLNARVMMKACVPDENGEVSLSLSLYNGAHLDECRRAGAEANRLLILECSPDFPRTRALKGHEHTLRLDEIAVIVVTDAKPTVLPTETGTPENFAIAEYAATYIMDGSTLQTGFCAVPNLVAQALVPGDGGDYGVPSEMFTDGPYEFATAGKITNARKEDRGISVTTFGLGSAQMYEFLNDNPSIGFATVSYTNDPSVIARNPRMVSINSALEVDLQGQIVADTLGSRQYSGVGGHVDFVEGTSLSLEHTSLICLQSTALVKGARKSRIIGAMDPHAVVTTPRHLSGVIVTKYGCADLRGLSVRERARAMTAIAHPDFRDELCACAESLGR